ncbi:hypothetical protein [Falsiroseomonas sp. CW058]|uniref:hypothetical protein n=1 Tax=Falsiroseomonas sp. CW058 TaxID=3388664 RepID=UPI003D311086
MAYLTFRRSLDFIEHARDTLRPAEGDFVMANGLGFALLMGGEVASRLSLSLSGEARGWLSDDAFSEARNTSDLAREIAARAIDILPSPSPEEAEDLAAVRAIHRMAVTGPDDLVLAAALGRAVLFRIEIPVFEREAAHVITMVLQPGARNPIAPAAGARVFDAALRGVEEAVASGIGVPLRIGVAP